MQHRSNYNIVAGINSYSVDEDGHVFLQLSKTDVDGNPVWTKDYVNPTDYYFDLGDMIINRKGNIIVCGDVNRQRFMDFDIVLMEIKSTDGTVIWSKTIRGSGNDEGAHICETGGRWICFDLQFQFLWYTLQPGQGCCKDKFFRECSMGCSAGIDQCSRTKFICFRHRRS